MGSGSRVNKTNVDLPVVGDGFSFLRFSLFNLNCLLNKVADLYWFLRVNKFHIVCVTETWLTPDFPSSIVDMPGFRFFRSDSRDGVAKHGVGMYVADGCRVGRVDTSLPNVLSVTLPDLNLLVVLVYRPPSYSDNDNNALLSFLHDIRGQYELVILGDFNLPSIVWKPSTVPVAVSRIDLLFLDIFSELGLYQWVCFPTMTRSDNVLDLVLTSQSDRVVDVDSLAPFAHCDHLPVCFTYQASSLVDRGVNPPVFDWFRVNFDELNAHFLSLDWDLLMSGCDVDAVYDNFLRCVSSACARYVPLKVQTERVLPWVASVHPGLYQCLKVRWRFYKCCRARFGRNDIATVRAWFEYRLSSRNLNAGIVVAVSDYESALVRRDPKCFHHYIRNKKSDSPSVGPLFVDGSWVSDSGAMAEVLASSFASVFVGDAAVSGLFPHQLSDSLFSLPRVDPSMVYLSLANLKPSTNSGPDGVACVLLKRCAVSLSYPLALLFRLSLSQGCVPRIWKFSNVLPLFKGGVRSNPSNYRPISSTSACSKALERILNPLMIDYLSVNNILSDKQFGFLAGRSVVDQLLLTYDYVSSAYDAGFVVDVIYLDYRKAFDTVHFATLIDKMSCLGFRSPFLDWISDYLLGRRMRVVVQGSGSDFLDVGSGVPQGSVLGPTLFLIFVNAVVSGISSKFCLFADDLKLYLASSRGVYDELVVDSLQADLDMIFAKSRSWGLEFSVNKCCCMRFCRRFSDRPDLHAYSIGGSFIENVSFHKDLGVLIDDSLKFHRHIRTIVAKASGVSQSILRGTLCRSMDFMKTVFVQHIRPLLEFSSPAWNTGYVGDLRLLEGVQRRWTKKISGLENLSYSERLRRLNLYSVEGRLIRADLIQVWRVVHGYCLGLDDLFRFSHSGSVVTRGHSFKLYLPRALTECRSRFFSVRVVRLWNELPAVVVSQTSLSSFKSCLARSCPDLLFRWTAGN